MKGPGDGSAPSKVDVVRSVKLLSVKREEQLSGSVYIQGDYANLDKMKNTLEPLLGVWNPFKDKLAN